MGDRGLRDNSRYALSLFFSLGDLVRPKGPISGGYVQKERSRMKSVSLIADARKRQIVVQENLAAAKEEFNHILFVELLFLE